MAPRGVTGAGSSVFCASSIAAICVLLAGCAESGSGTARVPSPSSVTSGAAPGGVPAPGFSAPSLPTPGASGSTSGGSSPGGANAPLSGASGGAGPGPGTSSGQTGGSPPTSGSTAGGPAAGGGGGAGSAPTGTRSLTKIYINSPDGTIFEYDSADWSVEVPLAIATGAFSIASGPQADTLYLQHANPFFRYGPLGTCSIVTSGLTMVGGDVYGNAFAEGRDGFLYSGHGVEFYRVDPNTGLSTYLGDGLYEFAGDLAVDPTTHIMYAAVAGPSGPALAIIHRANGGQTIVGTLGVSREVWGLGFSGNGELFAAGPDGWGGGAIYQVDKHTGAASVVRALSYEPFDMATQPYSVPEHEAL